ncbi:hypothetical protein LTR53_000374 [Teratosphaeriaceae sp. CCFEE 6253]|nr:hypothetical protein LTR53_000374 [Teratosphaeriaceae sp. CCFEE 6253]
MATAHQIQNALLTEHLRFTPLRLLDDVINNVNELVYRAINAIDEGLSAISPSALGFALSAAQEETLTTDESRQDAPNELRQTEIGNGCVQLESLLNATVDRDFDKFEIYTLRNILALGHDEEEARELAEWVRLEHYEHLDLATADGAVPSPEQVQLERRKLQETRKLNAMLKAEEAKNAAVLQQLGALLNPSASEPSPAGLDPVSPFAFLTSSPHTSQSSTSEPLTQNVQHVLAQLPALRALTAQLKASLQTLPAAHHAPRDADSTAARRRQYLDAQSQRAVARKGIVPDAGPRPPTEGRRTDDVAGIEAVVQALGGAREV